ncbi:MAG: hypothetical protein ACRD6X_15145 [Pyrinomonadaceae bacterium]
MSIRTNIEEIMNLIQTGNEQLGQEIRSKAVAAIKGGEGSPAWETYMSVFSQSPTQLARLLPTDGTQNDFDFDLARTYLVGNGTCGAETTEFHLIEGVDDELDEGL